MTTIETQIELQELYQKLCDTHNNSVNLIQDLIIYLTAKTCLEERNLKTTNETSVGGLLNSILNSHNYRGIRDKYLEAAYVIFPVTFKDFSFPTIRESIEELISDQNGLQKCYSFLKLSEYSENKKAEYSLLCKSQIIENYNNGEIAKTDKFSIDQKIELYKVQNFYELVFTDSENNEIKRINNIVKTGEAMGFIFFESNEFNIEFNREDLYFSPEITSVCLLDKNQNWIVKYSK